MKRIFFLAVFLLIASPAYPATNTFPATGDAGIGTTSPNVPLEVTTNATALPVPTSTAQVQIGAVDGTSSGISMDAFQNSNSGVGTGLFGRLYGGTNASPTAASGSMLELCGQPYNGTGLPAHNTACIVEATDGTQTTSSAPSNITFGTTPSGSTTRATVMEINNAGNVGIGTTSPAGKLDVEGGTAAASTDGSPINLVAQNAGSGNQNGGSIILTPGTGTGSGTAGGVGIGTTSPTAMLDVITSDYGATFRRSTGTVGGTINIGSGSYQWQLIGNEVNAGDLMFNNPGGNTVFYMSETGGTIGIGNTSPSYLLDIGSSSASGIVMELQNSSGACTYNPGASSVTVSCSSDKRLKSDIEDAGSALAWVDDMRIRDFTVRATGERKTGVIAQEIMRDHPDMVHENEDGFYSVDEPNPWMLVKTVQELHGMVSEQQSEIDELKKTIEQLEQQK